MNASIRSRSSGCKPRFDLGVIRSARPLAVNPSRRGPGGGSASSSVQTSLRPSASTARAAASLSGQQAGPLGIGSAVIARTSGGRRHRYSSRCASGHHVVHQRTATAPDSWRGRIRSSRPGAQRTAYDTWSVSDQTWLLLGGPLQPGRFALMTPSTSSNHTRRSEGRSIAASSLPNPATPGQ